MSFAARGALRLEREDVDLWICETASLGDSTIFESCASLLDDEERSRLGRLRVATRRLEFAAAHALVRTALSHYVEVAPRAWSFRRARYGKPGILAPSIPLHFSLSHTQGLVACAVARQKLGVDAEKIDPALAWTDLAARCFTPEEAQSLDRIECGAAVERFFELWTLKEAFSKALGLGLGLGFDQFGFNVQGGAYPKFPAVRPHPDLRPRPGEQWDFILMRPSAEHLVSVAALTSLRQMRMFALDGRELAGAGSAGVLREPAAVLCA